MHTCSFCLRASMAACLTSLYRWWAAFSAIFFSQEVVKIGFFTELALWLGSFQFLPELCIRDTPIKTRCSSKPYQGGVYGTWLYMA